MIRADIDSIRIISDVAWSCFADIAQHCAWIYGRHSIFRCLALRYLIHLHECPTPSAMHLSHLVRCIEFPEPTIVMTNIKIRDEDGGWNMHGQYSSDCDAGRNEGGGLSHYFDCYEGYENRLTTSSTDVNVSCILHLYHLFHAVRYVKQNKLLSFISRPTSLPLFHAIHRCDHSDHLPL